MIQGLRAGDAQELMQLAGADRRLFMRIGALLQERVSISRAVLEELASEEGLHALLMDRRLKHVKEDTFEALVEKHNCTDLGLCLYSEISDEEEPAWRTLVFDDELDNPLLNHETTETTRSDTDDWQTPVSNILPTLSANIRRPIEGLLAAQADEQRAAALEQLRYATPSLPIVSELMPMLLADSAELVRERAISLLVAAGAHPLLVDLIRALQQNNESALAQLIPRLPSLPAVQVELILSAILTLVSRGTMNQSMVHICTRYVEHIAHHRGLSRLLELFCLHGQHISLVHFIRGLQQYNASAIETSLRSLMYQTPKLDAALLILLARPDHPLDTDLLAHGLQLLLSQEEEPSERIALASTMRRADLNHVLGSLLVDQRHQIIESRDTTVYWLIGELSRDNALTQEEADALGDTIRINIRSNNGPHLVAILDQMIPALLPCSPEKQMQLVEPLGELAVRFQDQRSHELIIAILSRMNSSCCEPLWRLLIHHPTPAIRLIAATVLPQITPDDSAIESIQRLIESTDTDKATLAANMDAAAQLLERLDCQQTQSEAIELTKQLDDRCVEIGVQCIEAHSRIVAGCFIPENRQLELLEMFMDLLTAELPENSTTEYIDPTTDEITFILDEKLGAHTDLIPRILCCLSRIAISPHLPSMLLRRLVMTLIRQWKLVSTWQVIWGPGTIQELAHNMALIAADKQCPNELSLHVVESLLPRITHLRIAISLTSVLHSRTSPAMELLAARCAQRIITTCGKKHYADDELNDLVTVLIELLALPQLGEDSEHLQHQLTSLITSHRHHCTEQLQARIVVIRSSLPQALADKLDWA